MTSKFRTYLNTLAPLMTALAILYGSVFIVGHRIDSKLEEFSSNLLPVIVEREVQRILTHRPVATVTQEFPACFDPMVVVQIYRDSIVDEKTTTPLDYRECRWLHKGDRVRIGSVPVVIDEVEGIFVFRCGDPGCETFLDDAAALWFPTTMLTSDGSDARPPLLGRTID